MGYRCAVLVVLVKDVWRGGPFLYSGERYVFDHFNLNVLFETSGSYIFNEFQCMVWKHALSSLFYVFSLPLFRLSSCKRQLHSYVNSSLLSRALCITTDIFIAEHFAAPDGSGKTLAFAIWSKQQTHSAESRGKIQSHPFAAPDDAVLHSQDARASYCGLEASRRFVSCWRIEMKRRCCLLIWHAT